MTLAETSLEAYEAVKPLASELRFRVYIFIRTHHGATDEEIQDGTSLNPSTERPRRIELVQAGLVMDSGLTRPTRSGRNAIVWVALKPKKESDDDIRLAGGDTE